MSPSDLIGGPVAILRLPKSNPALLLYLKAIHDAMSASAALQGSNPSLGAFAARIGAFEDGEKLAATRAKGAAKARDAARRKALLDARHLRDFVQAVADAQPSAADAAAIIASAGMDVRRRGKFDKPPLVAKNGRVSGTAALVAKAVAKTASYLWQYSLDQRSWTNAAETLKAAALVSGLTSGQTYYFRFRALTRDGVVDWSQVVSLLVH